MKTFRIIIIALIAIAAVAYFFPQSCTTHPGELEQKAIHSLLIDSIVSAKTDSIIFANDSKIRRFKQQDSIQKMQIERLSSKYYALRAIVSKQKAVRIDSSTQIVEVPAVDYNASVNSGNLCDSLLIYQDQELAIKDSIISVREIQLAAAGKEITTKEQALTDLKALNAEEKKQFGRAHKLNNRIPAIAALSALAGSLFTIILLK